MSLIKTEELGYFVGGFVGEGLDHPECVSAGKDGEAYAGGEEGQVLEAVVYGILCGPPPGGEPPLSGDGRAALPDDRSGFDGLPRREASEPGEGRQRALEIAGGP